MNCDKENSDVYYLISELSKQIYHKQCLSLQHPYLQRKNDINKIKKLRSKAFGILLNKNVKEKYNQEKKKKNDPIIEIYKYAFVLKLHMRHVSRGMALESLLDEFSTNDLQTGSVVYLVLQLLTELKDLHNNDEESDLNIFYYSNTNPALFECLQTLENVTQFPTYPIETFILSKKLDGILDIQKCHIMQQTTMSSISRLYFYNQNISESSNKLESTRCKIDIDWLSRPKTITDFCSRDTISYFLPQTMKSTDCKINYINNCKKKGEIESDVSWLDIKYANEYTESGSDAWKSSTQSLYKEIVKTGGTYDDIWENIDINDTLIFNYHTWETLGEIKSAKQPNFLTDNPNAMLHLTRMKQISTLFLIPKKLMNSMDFPKEITIEEFLMNIKLLLLGIETKSFQYKNEIGFCMCQNMIVYGLSNESLVDICGKFIYLGNCFKYLTKLITPDSQSGKLLQEGLIFKAMCKSITEILLYYKATLLRIFKHINEYTGLLNMLSEVQPVALLLIEVAKLCQYNGENEQMGENCNIFTIINKKITKITLPQIALVFYTILKSCCVVYFRFLQKWLFEGICHDIYGEFMIKENPQFLREKGPKFWTRSFTIQNKSIPSFLNRLTESILQCGKAVRLLKICDPKNPVCSVFTSSQPELKVCLSVAMLREQFKLCQEYKQRGEEALGQPVSLSVAIQDRKNAEREKADVVIRAQQDTLLRIKREREEFLKTTIENKKEFLEALKKQANEATLCKAKEKQIELLTDKLLMEKNNQRGTELYGWKCSDRADLISYYVELDAFTQKQQIRMEWRNKRMKCYDKRVNALLKMEEILWNCTNVSDSQVLQDVTKNTTVEHEKTEESISNLQHVLNNIEPNLLSNNTTHEDENSNLNKVEIMKTPYKIIHTDNINVTIQSDDKQNTLQKSSDNKNIKKQFTEISDTHNASTLETPANMNYIYKCNNEKSSLQEFLRSEVVKELQSDVIINPFKIQPIINDNVTKTLLHPMETDVQTIHVDNQRVINRPKVLKVERFDNMTEAQCNKMRMLEHHFGATPNNNQSNLFCIQEENNQNDCVIEANNLPDNMTEAQCNKMRMLKHHFGVTPNNNQSNLFSIQEENNQNDCVIEANNLPEENNEHYQTSYISNNVANDKTTYINPIETIKTLKLLQYYKTLDKINIGENLEYVGEVNNANETTSIPSITDGFALSIRSTMPHIQMYEDLSPLDVNSLSSNVKLNSTPSSGFSEHMFAITTPSASSTDINTPDSATSLTIADVELIDNTSLQVYLEQSIIIPLQIQSRIVNDALIKYLLNEHNMLIHLQSLRSYFFLLNGEFAKCLTNSLYARLYEISVPVELFNSATLTNLLERALINSFSSNYMNSELLSLSAIDTPMQLHISDPNALDCLCLSYKISWPLNIILDDVVMLQYSKVFKFLLMIGRVLWVLQEDFRMMKAEHKAAISEQYHKLQLYRHSMTQFICALHNYITCSVLHTSWIEFEKDLCNCLTIDQIRLSHVNYIKKILSRCMLNTRGEKVRTCLGNIFKVILKFHNRLRSQNWILSFEGTYIHPNFKKLEQMYESFCEWRTYLSRIALKLTTSGYQPHLIHFLNTLNINHIYDLSEKSS